MVRLRSGDDRPDGPGFGEYCVQGTTEGDYPARTQPVNCGSFIIVPAAPVFDAIRRLFGIYDEISRMEPENRRSLVFLMMAITVAKTPDVPIPR